MSLAEQAIRLRRAKWGTRADLLSEELYSILLTDKDPKTGPVTINFPDGSASTDLPPEALIGPLGDFLFPDLSFPSLVLPQTPDFSEENPDDERIFQRVRKQEKHERIMAPGFVMGGSGANHVVSCYPYGVDGQATKGRILEEDIFGANVTANVRELNGQTIPVGTYVMVFRHVFYIIVRTEIVEKKGENENILSASTEFNIISENNEMVAGGGTSCFPAQITGGGPGQDYEGDVYENGIEADPVTGVDIKQLDIDEAETIPEGTWLLVAKVNGVYYGQVPIFL